MTKPFIFFLAAMALVWTPVLSAPTQQASNTVSPLIQRTKDTSVAIPVSAGRMFIPLPSFGSGKPAKRPVVWSQTLDIDQLRPGRKNVVWSRIRFSSNKTSLRMPASKPSKAGWGENLAGDVVKITSLLDNSVQFHNAETLKQWSYNSAFFNGAKIKIELLADPSIKSGKPSLVIENFRVNGEEGSQPDDLPIPPRQRSLCNRGDLRQPSSDPRLGRVWPVACTGWTINDTNGCLLTAGHCFDGHDAGEQVLQFNVPASTIFWRKDNQTDLDIPVANVRHPHADSQFAIDVESVQHKLIALGGVNFVDDEDWAYFGTHRNPNTGLTAREYTKGQVFTLAQVDKTTGKLPVGLIKKGDMARVTGFGYVRFAAPERFNLTYTQQTHVGPIHELIDDYHMSHRVDSEPGNSGSPIILESTGVAVGVHTNGGCQTHFRGSSNWGATMAMRGLQQALASPKGVCGPAKKA
ncbi:hypothetical protein BCR44DRAFT_119363 [Catenaria anguillulae PL171]|uniref:Serine protease n=1 Tax=Catenaria anguillulae PL171 TaxID=765915 RepID=A0A1Y2HPR4_9FUNG|nr:hypothetical protein BCR44DRAFT_119363 [Catenaria anguillulae PL171]